jgi:REP element-mobilizing transposase RayT
MAYDPARHRRRSIRLPDYDYAAPGWYFVTVCEHQRRLLFGTVAHGTMHLSAAGRIVQTAWHDLPDHYPHVRLDAFVVMPNHVHGIIGIVDTVNPNDVAEPTAAGSVTVGAGLNPAPTDGTTGGTRNNTRHGLPEIVRAFKTFSARRVNRLRGTPGAPVWQRNYWERIVRTDRELANVRRYIAENPQCWHRDRLRPRHQLR